MRFLARCPRLLIIVSIMRLFVREVALHEEAMKIINESASAAIDFVLHLRESTFAHRSARHIAPRRKIFLRKQIIAFLFMRRWRAASSAVLPLSARKAIDVDARRGVTDRRKADEQK